MEDLEYAFVGQITKRIRNFDKDSDDHMKKQEPDVVDFPLSEWRMASLFDEREMGEEYWQALDRRVGRQAEREVEVLQKQNKPVVEKKIDRGFDIVRTWDIKGFMD